jgi:23S rRNA (cytidine1920-2'-O)/16S rRNA (cytidine1409-2'-O)-methyltransferase
MARLDKELVSRGMARSRSHAAQLIAAGRVLRGGTALSKASAVVPPEEELTLTDPGVPDYVSRAGHKLAGALEAFPGVSVAGRRCLDAGASTGGFTDVLLRAGAAGVVAVDVGHGQLVPALREDPRVSVHEGVNVRYLDARSIGGPVDLTVADLSFISLTLVIQPLAAATVPGGDMVLMVKPQFEVGRRKLGNSGVVASEADRRQAVDSVAMAALRLGLDVRGVARSPLPGQDGNVEFFMWTRVPADGFVPRIEEDAGKLADHILATRPQTGQSQA